MNFDRPRTGPIMSEINNPDINLASKMGFESER
jgi:hypothetical protein